MNRGSKFSGHQTFSFRYGWLEKGYRFIESGGSFKDETAFVELGVGKNMADSIRYWCEMTGVTSEEELTPFAKSLLDEKNGWDPYLEDIASLWLLHWKLITNPDFQTAGTALLSYLQKPEFSNRDVADAALRLADAGCKSGNAADCNKKGSDE